MTDTRTHTGRLTIYELDIYGLDLQGAHCFYYALHMYSFLCPLKGGRGIRKSTEELCFSQYKNFASSP